MNIWHELPKEDVTPERFSAVIEITKGSKNKYELDKRTGLLRLDRILHTSTHSPANYGFLPLTYAGDGDPLDVPVICSEPILPMTLVECRPVGVMKMTDGGKPDEKTLAVPSADPYYRSVRDLGDLPSHVFGEMRRFFTVYTALEDRNTAVDELGNREEAESIIRTCLESYKTHHYRLVHASEP